MLRQLPRSQDPNLLVGPEHHSDAGVYRVGEDLAIVQTVDFFAPLTNDPRVFGEIAAANSLSDVYAMGARPITALNIVAFPDDQLPLETLNEILAGGAEKTLEAGASILGGHTIRDTEIKYGLSVTGLVDPKRLITNMKAQPGDVLVLTKPIGTGAMTAAYQKGKVSEAHWQSCCDEMARLNGPASRAMVAAGAHAATDITGFGLLGHACEVAEASKVTLEIEAGKVPLLEGARALSDKGYVTRAVATNGAYVESLVEMVQEPPKALYNLIVDAQTSGGLLVALDESRLEDFAKAMEAENLADTWSQIGHVTEHSGPAIRLR